MTTYDDIERSINAMRSIATTVKYARNVVKEDVMKKYPDSVEAVESATNAFASTGLEIFGSVTDEYCKGNATIEQAVTAMHIAEMIVGVNNARVIRYSGRIFDHRRATSGKEQ